MSTLRLPHREQTSRSRHSGTVVSAPYPLGHLVRIRFDLVAARLAPPGQPHARRAAFPSVIGGPGCISRLS
jgi:hypothetical protein